MATLVTEANTSFARGMNDSAAATAMRADEASLLLNYRVTADGQAEVRRGSQRTHTNALNSGAQGYGGVEFRTASGAVQWVVFVGDKAYRSTDQGATWPTVISTGLRTDYWDFAVMRVGASNVLYCANGSATIYSWDGTTWATVTGPATGIKLIEAHSERLWASDGVQLYFSKVRDPSTWGSPYGGSVQVTTYDGDGEVTGLYSLGGLLLFWKRRSMGYISGDGAADLIVAAGARGISRDVGCVGFRTIVGVAGGGVMWMSERGFELYFPGGVPELASTPVSTFLRDISWGDIRTTPGLPCAYWYPRRLTYEAAIPATVAQNDYRFVYRLPSGDLPGACSLLSGAASGGYTLYVDADGYLALDSSAARNRVRTDGGYLTLAAGSTSGVYVTLDADGHLGLSTNPADPAVVFPADRGTEAAVPVAVGMDGFVRNLDTGTRDDVLSDGTGGVLIGDRLRTRPFLHRALDRRKRLRVVRLRATNDQQQTPAVVCSGDGMDGPAQTATLKPSAGGMPQEARLMVSRRGVQHVVEIQGAGAGTRISAVLVEAEIEQRRP